MGKSCATQSFIRGVGMKETASDETHNFDVTAKINKIFYIIK